MSHCSCVCDLGRSQGWPGNRLGLQCQVGRGKLLGVGKVCWRESASARCKLCNVHCSSGRGCSEVLDKAELPDQIFFLILVLLR